MCFYFSVFHQRNNIIVLLSLFPSSYHSKIKSKNRKKYKIILVFGKVTQVVAKALLAIRIKKKIVKVEPQD